MRMVWAFTLVGSLATVAASAREADPVGELRSPYAKWKNGPPGDGTYFPIAVWLQEPKLATRYKEAGINLYVGLWKGPTEAQLATLKDAGMPVICSQNDVGLQHRADPLIVGWMHGDEPDNAQSLGKGKGYGPPIPPETIIADYKKTQAADPTRPVLLNLGQGVAWDGWIGRGVRTNHPEDYPEYVKGCDIASFDIYPVASPRKAVQGKLWYVAHGVERLRKWAGDARPTWNCIECTRIGSETKATPHQVRAEVWMALIHGSQGLVYFVHEWKPKFNDHALLDDPAMLKAVSAINRQVHELAPVLNSPTLRDMAKATPSNEAMPIATMVKRLRGATFVFAVAMRDGATQGSFEVAGLPAVARAEVLGEGRQIAVESSRFADAFEPYDVHLYRIE